jgi:hypothetical protein
MSMDAITPADEAAWRKLTQRARRRPATSWIIPALAAAMILSGCATTPPYVPDGCTRADLDGHSVARVWDEQVLSLVRQVVPAPTEHARNLFHVSAAMWDAWAAYDRAADGYFVTERLSADDVQSARETAMSYAAYRILVWRYGTVADLPSAKDELDATMASLCYETDFTATEGDSPAAFGNRIAATVLEYGRTDGALEEDRYADPSYQPRNDPLVVADPGTTMREPSHWQPLSLGLQLSQNGLPIPGKIQSYIGSHWGYVRGFALPEVTDGLPIDPGPPPRLEDPATADAFKQEAVEVIRASSALDPADGVMIDIGPGARGASTLGTNDGRGHPQNPATGQPYEPDMVLQADFYRVLAEWWADGPTSETPPGHWNLVANRVTDAPDFERRLGGGPPLDPLEWDVKTYFALNGALHDAAIAAWGAKAAYDSARPISMIRYMGGLGQSSDPAGPAYDPAGLPLEPDLIEIVTPESGAPGQRHESLRDHVGEVAVRAWRGNPDDPEAEVSGVGWIRAVDWVPYQRPTFVTPAFAGYVSGHSTFSRAGAEVLSALTGDPFFPGGIATWTIPAGTLLHEEGPTQDLTLQWATYADAADQAGESRIYGGIHPVVDDLAGRRIGAEVGQAAAVLAERYFDGSARP